MENISILAVYRFMTLPLRTKKYIFIFDLHKNNADQQIACEELELFCIQLESPFALSLSLYLPDDETLHTQLTFLEDGRMQMRPSLVL